MVLKDSISHARLAAFLDDKLSTLHTRGAWACTNGGLAALLEAQSSDFAHSRRPSARKRRPGRREVRTAGAGSTFRPAITSPPPRHEVGGAVVATRHLAQRRNLRKRRPGCPATCFWLGHLTASFCVVDKTDKSSHQICLDCTQNLHVSNGSRFLNNCIINRNCQKKETP